VKRSSSLKDTFGFFTILPVSGGSLQRAAASAWLLPLVAVALGAAEGAVAWGASRIFGPLTTAALALSLVLILTGFHHADGLADMGDALMARGDHSRRLEVLKDRTVGVGAIGALLLTFVVSWAALAEATARLEGARVIAALVVAEVCARLCLVLVAVMTPSSHEGSGSAFIAALRGGRGAAAIALSLAVLTAAAPLMIRGSVADGFIAVLSAALAAAGAAALVMLLARRWFGGAGGDILGASVEWGRMAALLALAASLA